MDDAVEKRGNGFNATIDNHTDEDFKCFHLGENCMYHVASIFGNDLTVLANNSRGGYLEAKQSGSCAFERSEYSFHLLKSSDDSLVCKFKGDGAIRNISHNFSLYEADNAKYTFDWIHEAQMAKPQVRTFIFTRSST